MFSSLTSKLRGLGRSISGFTLLEATIVLAILGIVVAGIWIASAGAINAQKKKRLAEDVLTTVANIRDYVKNIDIPAGKSLTTADIQNLGLFPADVVRNGVTINPYSGIFQATADNNQIVIIVNGLTTDACVDLLYNHFGGSSNVTTGSATTGNQPQDIGFLGYSTGAAFPPQNTSVTFTAITTACNAPQGSALPTFYLSFSP